MSWPKLSESERWVDWSYYQNDASMFHRPFDVDAFCAAHPEVEGAIIRAVWPSGIPDQLYGPYYDGFTRNNRKVAAYLWPNPTKPVNKVMEDWKRALGERIPKLLFDDWEATSTFADQTPQKLTATMQATWAARHAQWPNQRHASYSRGTWLTPNIIVGDWFHEIPWWLAHYIFPDDVQPLKATHWIEVDAMLPISNNFTPRRGPVRIENVIGWQFSDGGLIVPRGTSDLDYLLKSFVGPIYGDAPPPVAPLPSPNPPVPVTLRFPEGRIELTIERAA